MRLHERTLRVQHAKQAIDRAISDAWGGYALTAVEVVSVLVQLTAEHLKYALREERHPDDPGKKADEA